MSYDVYIFDLDGVICHTDNYHYIAWKELANKLNIDFDENKNNLLRGVSRMESLNILLGARKDEFTEDEKVKLAAEKNDTYVKLLDKMSNKDLSNDVLNTLKTLQRRNKKIAIGSSSKNAKIILNKLGIIDMFDAIVDGNDIKNSKPDPEVFLLASEKLGYEPSKCLVIEDALSGVEAGINGGFDVAGIGDATKHSKLKIVLQTISDLL